MIIKQKVKIKSIVYLIKLRAQVYTATRCGLGNTTSGHTKLYKIGPGKYGYKINQSSHCSQVVLCCYKFYIITYIILNIDHYYLSYIIN